MSECDHVIGTAMLNYEPVEARESDRCGGYASFRPFDYCPLCGTPLRGEWSSKAPSEVGEYWVRRKGDSNRTLIDIRPRDIGTFPELDDYEFFSLPVRGPDQ